MLYILKGNENKTKPMGENNLKNIPSVLFLRAWANVKPKLRLNLIIKEYKKGQKKGWG